MVKKYFLFAFALLMLIVFIGSYINELSYTYVGASHKAMLKYDQIQPYAQNSIANQIIIFSESGLPSNALWNVSANGQEYNAISPLDIQINLQPQSNMIVFSVSNLSIGNYVFVPSPYSANAYANNNVQITFTKTMPNNAIYYSTSTTTTSTSSSTIQTSTSTSTTTSTTTPTISSTSSSTTQSTTSSTTSSTTTLLSTSSTSSSSTTSILPTTTNKTKNATAIISNSAPQQNSTDIAANGTVGLKLAISGAFNRYKNSIMIVNTTSAYNNSANTSAFGIFKSPKISSLTAISAVNNMQASAKNPIFAPAYLNSAEMSNMTPLNATNIKSLTSQIAPYIGSNSNSSIVVVNKSQTVQYGNISYNGKYIIAGAKEYYLAYNQHNTMTIYNVSVTKATPTLDISVLGGNENATNSTTIIRAPFIKGQMYYNLSGEIKSKLNAGNNAKFYYEVMLDNTTVYSGASDSASINVPFSIRMMLNQTVSLDFSTNGNSNYSAVDPTIIVIPTSIEYYVPITISNLQATPTPSPFQQMLTVNSLSYSSYESGNLDNIEFFYSNGIIVPSWMEGSSNQLLNNPTNAVNLYHSANTIYWLNLGGGIGASNSVTIYMGFSTPSINLLNSLDNGEAPQISPQFGEFDDGTSVFTYYDVSPSSTSGWTTHGTAGQTSSAPSGNHYGTSNALYANSANGDYMYIPVSGLNDNSIISFDVYTTGLGNLFFLTSSSGAGQMGRLDGRGGGDYSGLATTASWTSWSAPSPGIDEAKDTWYKFDIVISGATANAYIGGVSGSISTLGTLASSKFSVLDNGDYIGLIGDGLGSSYLTYWDGIVIRSNPPNGVMPLASFGIVESSNAPVLLIQNNPVSYGNSDIISAISSNPGDNLELFENGLLVAGPSTNTITYTICNAPQSLSSCQSPASYSFSVNDLTSGLDANAILNVIKANPSLTISAPKIVLYNGSSIKIPYSISTVGNQLQSSFYINGAEVSTSYSNGIYSFNPAGIGLYNLSLSTSGNGNYLSNIIYQNVCVLDNPISTPSNIIAYAPICVVNNQNTIATGPFQEQISINESLYKNYLQYSPNKANFEIFNAIGAVNPSWIEQNATGNLTIWTKMPSGIPANSISPIYIGFASNSINLLSSLGTYGIGEFPTATSTYAQYDNGNSVFNNYFNGGSSSGWNIIGTAGQTSAAPSGSPFGLNAFYANGANGDYLDTIANNQSDNSIIEYYTYTQNLDDLFFLVNSAGAGQIARVGNGAGWYGIASAGAWTSWSAPPDSGTWSNAWLLIGLAITNGNAQMFVSTSPGIYGSEIGSNPSNIYGVANDGSYLGFVGDAAGGTTTQYMNGLIIRTYPPNGVMPYSIEGSAIASALPSTCTISLGQNSINFGQVNPSVNMPTVNSIVDSNGGNANAYMFVSASSWTSGANSFGAANTVWSALYNTPYSLANPISATISNSLIYIPATSSNTIYFGLGIPGAIPSGVYTQTITIENSC